MKDLFNLWLGYAFLALIVYSIAYSIYKYYKDSHQPYHKYVKHLKKRERIAINNFDASELKQLAVEKMWLENVERNYMMDFGMSNLLDLTQQKLDAAKHRVLAQIPTDKLMPPSAHNYSSKDYRQDRFLKDIISKCLDAVVDSPYANTPFLPESILPFPKAYVLFAIDKCLSNHPSDNEKVVYNAAYNMVFRRAINVKPELLPVEREENRRVGNLLRSA